MSANHIKASSNRISKLAVISYHHAERIPVLIYIVHVHVYIVNSKCPWNNFVFYFFIIICTLRNTFFNIIIMSKLHVSTIPTAPVILYKEIV